MMFKPQKYPTHKTIISALTQINSRTLSASVLLAITLFLPALVHNQLVTGPIINATLLLSFLVLGPAATLTLGMIPSLIALNRGLLPVVLAPALPFIMVSNALYILTFAYFWNQKKITQKASFKFIIAFATGSLAKFAFLSGTSRLILPSLLSSPQLTTTIIFMLGLPQLATALIGGVIAYLVWNRFLKNLITS